MNQTNFLLYALRGDELKHCRREIDSSEAPAAHYAIVQAQRIFSELDDASAYDALTHLIDILEIDRANAAPYDLSDARQREGAEHDEYFGIARITGQPLSIFVQSMLFASRELIWEQKEEGSSLVPQEWVLMRNSFEPVFRFMLRGRASSHQNIILSAEDPYRNESPAPMTRWRIGHHYFLVIIQAMVVALGYLHDACLQGDVDEALESFALATHLLLYSALALRFTGDFHPEHYKSTIRPSMSPPELAPGFSGIMSSDHQILAKLINPLPLEFLLSEPRLKAQHEEFLSVLDGVYESHKLVCARFIGYQKPSLRMPPDSKKSAVEVLDDFKVLRIRNASRR